MSYGWFPKLNSRGDRVSTGLGLVAVNSTPVIVAGEQLRGFGPGWVGPNRIAYGIEFGQHGRTMALDTETMDVGILSEIAYNTIHCLESGRWVGWRPDGTHLYRHAVRERSFQSGRVAVSENRLAYTDPSNQRLTIEEEFIVVAPIMDLALTDQHAAWIKAVGIYDREAYVDNQLVSFDLTEYAIWVAGDWVMTAYSGGYKIRPIGSRFGYRFRTGDFHNPAFGIYGSRLVLVGSTSRGEPLLHTIDIGSVREDLSIPDTPPHTDHADHADTPHSDHADIPHSDHADTPHSDHADAPHGDTHMDTPEQPPRVVAFGPSPASEDWMQLFTEDNLWSKFVRDRVAVIHFGLGNLLDFTTGVEGNTYQRFVDALAFRKLKEWGIKIELGTDGAAVDVVHVASRLVSAGNELSFVTYDKVFHEIDPDDFADRCRFIKRTLPDVLIGVFAAYPFKSVEDIRRRLIEFDRRGCRPSWLRLDVDPGQRSALTPRAFQQFREMCDDRQIALQYVVNARDGLSDQQYVADAKTWFGHARSLGKWDGTIVQSWATRDGRFILPKNLPESDPTSHTALLKFVIERLLS